MSRMVRQYTHRARAPLSVWLWSDLAHGCGGCWWRLSGRPAGHRRFGRLAYLLTFDLLQVNGANLLVVRTGATRVGEADAPSPRRSVAEKLEHLFHSVRGPRGEYSLEEVAEGIRDRGGPTISASYIWQLRKGVKDNPTKKHMEALADFFGVPAAYFFDDDAAARIEAELSMLAALRDAGVRRVALRAAGLSPRSLAAIQTIIESARDVEGLADSPAQARGAVPADDEDSPQSETTTDGS